MKKFLLLLDFKTFPTQFVTFNTIKTGVPFIKKMIDYHFNICKIIPK